MFPWHEQHLLGNFCRMEFSYWFVRRSWLIVAWNFDRECRPCTIQLFLIVAITYIWILWEHYFAERETKQDKLWYESKVYLYSDEAWSLKCDACVEISKKNKVWLHEFFPTNVWFHHVENVLESFFTSGYFPRITKRYHMQIVSIFILVKAYFATKTRMLVSTWRKGAYCSHSNGLKYL